jgi:hypothetical protein
LEIPVGEWDSIPLPIYVTNDTTLIAFSFGLHYDLDDLEILSVDTTGSVLPSDWHVSAITPGDSGYIWPVPDSNVVYVIGCKEPAGAADFVAQEGGLLVTLWLRTPSGMTGEAVDFDTAYVPPIGELIFSPLGGGSLRPGYVDCGAEDVIIGAFLCGDADGSGQVDVDDIVFMIDCIFVDCLGVPMERLDADCSGELDIDDVVYLIMYVFAGGNAPCDIDGDGVPDC